jgi:tetratricopeptide (TPR) repeat protein
MWSHALLYPAQHDPISEMLQTHFPTATRKTLPSVESVSMDMAGLRRLVREGCYHAALELTGRFLSAHGQGLGQAGQPSLHTHKTLQMWAARLALLVAMQQYHEAELELAAFADLVNPDLYYQYHTHNYPGKTGSMVPFSMRLLHAQLPSYTGNHQQSLDRLCLLQHTCQEVLSEVRRGYLPFVSEPLTPEDQQVADSLWLERLTRVKFSLANTLVTMQDYLLAVQVYESLLDQLPGLQEQLLSVMGRLYLTLGDLPSAQDLFSQAATAGGGDKAVRTHINQGLVNVYLGRWQLAKDSFESALQLDPGNLTLRNNIAVCTFYQGHLKECISDLEGVVGSSPPSSLQPALFCNLTAAYDLESSSAHSKKLSFLPLLGQHVGEGFPLTSLSVQ